MSGNLVSPPACCCLLFPVSFQMHPHADMLHVTRGARPSAWQSLSRFVSKKCRQDTHSQHTSVQYSLFTSAERTPRAWLKSHGLQCHLCAPEKNLSAGVAHVSPVVVISLAVYHEHFLFLIHSSFHHDTRTHSTIGTTRSNPRTPSTSCTSPCSPSRQAAP